MWHTHRRRNNIYSLICSDRAHNLRIYNCNMLRANKFWHRWRLCIRWNEMQSEYAHSNNDRLHSNEKLARHTRNVLRGFRFISMWERNNERVFITSRTSRFDPQWTLLHHRHCASFFILPISHSLPFPTSATVIVWDANKE